jgi:glyoxylase I family protein
MKDSSSYYLSALTNPLKKMAFFAAKSDLSLSEQRPGIHALQSTLMFQGIEHLAISSPNPEKLAQWYADHLGFHINFSYAGNYFVRAANGAMMEIIPANNSLTAPQELINNKDAGFRHLAIAIDDFDAGVADLKAKGVRMVGEPFETQGNRLAFFNDADGNLVHLIKREKPLP